MNEKDELNRMTENLNNIYLLIFIPFPVNKTSHIKITPHRSNKDCHYRQPQPLYKIPYQKRIVENTIGTQRFKNINWKFECFKTQY